MVMEHNSYAAELINALWYDMNSKNSIEKEQLCIKNKSGLSQSEDCEDYPSAIRVVFTDIPTQIMQKYKQVTLYYQLI